MTHEEIQSIRKQFELNGITCWMGEYKALHKALDALENAREERNNWQDAHHEIRKEADHYRKALQEIADIGCHGTQMDCCGDIARKALEV